MHFKWRTSVCGCECIWVGDALICHSSEHLSSGALYTARGWLYGSTNDTQRWQCEAPLDTLLASLQRAPAMAEGKGSRPGPASLTWASILARLSSSSLRRRMFSLSCLASENACRNWSKIPKNSSGCRRDGSSPKWVTDFWN